MRLYHTTSTALRSIDIAIPPNNKNKVKIKTHRKNIESIEKPTQFVVVVEWWWWWILHETSTMNLQINKLGRQWYRFSVVESSWEQSIHWWRDIWSPLLVVLWSWMVSESRGVVSGQNNFDCLVFFGRLSWWEEKHCVVNDWEIPVLDFWHLQSWWCGWAILFRP